MPEMKRDQWADEVIMAIDCYVHHHDQQSRDKLYELLSRVWRSPSQKEINATDSASLERGAPESGRPGVSK